MLKKQLYVEPQAEVLEVQGEAFVCLSNTSLIHSGNPVGSASDDDFWDED